MYKTRFSLKSQLKPSILSVHLVLLVMVVVAGFPIFFTIMGGMRTTQDILANPNAILPDRISLENFINAWNLANFSQFTFNSVFLAFFIVTGTIITTTVAGYCFERGKFRFKEPLFVIILSSMFISVGSLTLFPIVRIAQFLGVNQSLWGIVLVRVMGLNVAMLFVARGYISTIPKELDEAAKIDGCSFFGTFVYVIFPLLKPLIATVGILTFRSAWNDFLLPLVFTMATPERQPLVVGVVGLQNLGETAANWSLMLAGTSIAIVPMIVVFLIFNKQFISGLQEGGLKG